MSLVKRLEEVNADRKFGRYNEKKQILIQF